MKGTPFGQSLLIPSKEKKNHFYMIVFVSSYNLDLILSQYFVFYIDCVIRY